MEISNFMKKKFGKRLRELRLERGLTQEQIAERIHIEPENYSRLENGLSFPKPENIEKLATAFNVKISELFQFQKDDNIELIREQLIQKITIDEESAKIAYEFLLRIGKL